MTANDDHFEEFGDHTNLKHLILTSYLRAWAALVINARAHAHGWFVDAFAGRGMDANGNAGSPLIACKVAREVEEKFPSDGDGRRLRIFAIERERDNYDSLVASTKDCTTESYVIPLHGTLEDHLDAILATGTASDPRLFFLDPFGVKGLRADIVGRILSVRQAEILLLFNDVGANRLLGAARKKTPTALSNETLSLFQGTAPESAGSGQTNASDATAPAAEAILRTAFGDAAYERAVSAVAGSSPNERQRAWRSQYVQTLRDLGAGFVVHFSVRDRENKHRYYLMHASTHWRAIEKMKEAIHTATLQHGRGAEQDELFYQTTVDINTVLDSVQSHFAGRSVRWTDKTNRDTVRAFLVERTDALLSDLPEIQERMTSRGWLTQKKPKIYTIS